MKGSCEGAGPGRLFAWALALAALGAADPAAAARRCPKIDEKAADRQLWLNARDSALAIAKHLPWDAFPEQADGVVSDRSEKLYAQRDYVTWYDSDLRIPLFTAERVDARRLGRVKRVDCFRRDPRIDAHDASYPSDYDEAIFDQGHLAAFANQDTSKIAGNNSFVMSNMVPQTCQFNRGIWQILEGITRIWTRERKTIWVISGSILDRDADGARDDDARAARMLARNGTARVAIPTAFYKIVAIEQPDGSVETISFLMPHNQENPEGQAALDYLARHVATLDEIERRTGRRFFTGALKLAQSNTLWPIAVDKIPNSLCSAAPRADFDEVWRD